MDLSKSRWIDYGCALLVLLFAPMALVASCETVEEPGSMFDKDGKASKLRRPRRPFH